MIITHVGYILASTFIVMLAFSMWCRGLVNDSLRHGYVSFMHDCCLICHNKMYLLFNGLANE